MNMLKILDKTKQQKLDFLQSKIIILKYLEMTEQDYHTHIMNIGEQWVRTYWQKEPELQRQILTDKRLRFWTLFTYEWYKHDIEVVHYFLYKNISLDRETYRNLKANYLTANAEIINNIKYDVQGNIDHFYGC